MTAQPSGAIESATAVAVVKPAGLMLTMSVGRLASSDQLGRPSSGIVGRADNTLAAPISSALLKIVNKGFSARSGPALRMNFSDEFALASNEHIGFEHAKFGMLEQVANRGTFHGALSSMKD